MKASWHGSRTVRCAVVAASLALLIIVGVSGCSSSGTKSSTSTATVISLKSLMFNPTTLTVKVGTKVTWRNDEPITHTVTSGTYSGIDPATGLRSDQHADGRFNATLNGAGDTFSYTFTTPGTYSYFCSIHHGMNSAVVVTG